MLPEKSNYIMHVPKTKIYEKYNFSPGEKRLFDTDISSVCVVNIISPDTVNIEAGAKTKSVFITKVVIKNEKYKESNLLKLVRLIPQKQVLLLEYNNRYKLCMFYKKLYSGDWQNEPDLSIKGSNLDLLWENWLKDIIGGKWNDNLSFEENLEIKDKITFLLKLLNAKETKLRKEVQTGKRFDLHNETVRLRKEIKAEEEKLIHNP